MSIQQRGSITALLAAVESAFNTVTLGASRRTVVLPIVRESLSATRPQNRSGVIRRRRDGPSQPFLGFRDVKGQITVAADLINIGRVLKMLAGSPVSTHGYTGADIKTGSPTLAYTTSTGAYVFSAPQTAPLQVGDRIVATLAGTTYSFWITTYTNTTTGVAQNERAGGGATYPSGTYTVVAVIRNQSTAGAPTITITDGVGVPSVAQPNAREGDLIIYANTAGTYSSAWIGTVNSPSNFSLVDQYKFPLRGGTVAQGGRDITASAIDAIERPGLTSHVFKAGQTSSLPSWTLEKQFLDLSPVYTDRYSGCKANQVGINVGGDQELVLTVDIVGAGFAEPAAGAGLDSGRFATIPAAAGGNVGTGTCSTPVITDGNPIETVTLTCTVPATNAGTFSVVGTVSGTLPTATVGVAYSHGGLSFTIADGGTDFDTDDVFTFLVKQTPVASPYQPQFEQFDATITTDGDSSADNPVQTANVTIINKLDESGYTVNGHQTRTQLPEGIMEATWAVKALFKDTALLGKATGDEEGAISVSFTRDDGQSLTIATDRLKYSQADPTVQSEAGVTIDLSGMSYNQINDPDPCVYFTLVNTQPAYE